MYNHNNQTTNDCYTSGDDVEQGLRLPFKH